MVHTQMQINKYKYSYIKILFILLSNLDRKIPVIIREDWVESVKCS
jgi:hypothetical protein